jgi:4-diphosphocytidyl-2-C-methyl-D-erythritol kinase
MPVSPARVRAHALAKINLHLEILARRADGYHDLRTVFQSIALHDTVTIEPWDGPFTIVCDDPGVPLDATNLVWRAADAAACAWGRDPLTGLHVTIEKRVPARSGLGGGSADAMATLRALAHLWRVDVAATALMALGRPLGADVAFFAIGGTALGTGRGDILSPTPDLPPHALVILRPPFGVGTADAYRWVAESRAGITWPEVAGLEAWPAASADWTPRLAGCRNDFEPVVAARHPLVADLVADLRRAGAALALLSGSGSAVVGLFADPAAAQAAAAQAGHRGASVLVTATVPAADYARTVAPVEAEIVPRNVAGGS